MTQNINFYSLNDFLFTIKSTDTEWMFIDISVLLKLNLLNQCESDMLLYIVTYFPLGVNNAPLLLDYIDLEQYIDANPHVDSFQVVVTKDCDFIHD